MCAKGGRSCICERPGAIRGAKVRPCVRLAETCARTRITVRFRAADYAPLLAGEITRLQHPVFGSPVRVMSAMECYVTTLPRTCTDRAVPPIARLDAWKNKERGKPMQPTPDTYLGYKVRRL